MYSESLDQWFKANKNFTNPFMEWNKLATEICRHVAEQNIELLGENVSRMSEQLKRISHVKRPDDLLNLQKEIITEDVAAVIENTQKVIHLALESMEQCTKLCGTMRDTTVSAVNLATKHQKEKVKERETEKEITG